MSMPAIDEFIVKVSSRCNINCDYCYEYNQGDDSWRSQSKRIALETIKTLADRILEHASKHQLKHVTISIHGGEPLLLGPRLFESICSTLTDTFKDEIELSISVQSNGMLITREFTDIFRAFNVSVGISLDGTKLHNDRHRKSPHGHSTFEQVLRGINILRENAPALFAGVLGVVDLRNDPIEVVDAIYQTGARNIDLLLPHHNWNRPPPKLDKKPTPYADWYMRVWTPWITGRWPDLRIRFLENIVMRLAGHPGIYEQMSVSAATLVSINTNGDIEQVDTLKSTGSGIQRTSLNIFQNSFDHVLEESFYRQRCFPMNSLCDICNSCSMRNICVGGYLPHRYSAAKGFDNPSVYCSDLLSLMTEIERCLKKAEVTP